MTAPRGRGRPSRPAVTREGLAAAALEITRAAGYEKLTMSRVAAHLGVAPSALYNHVSGKADLLVLLQDAVMGEVSVVELQAAASGGVDVGEAVRAWARSYRAVFADHTPLIPVISTLPVEGAEKTVRMYDALAAALTAAGVPQDRIMARVIALEAFLFGAAYDVHAPAEIFSLERTDEDLPALRTATEAFRERLDASGRPPSEANPYADDPFELGLLLLTADL
ncbi:TetR/AcrR family transcriptional regulator [Micrococcus lylae]|uniref:TetR/AcrR family transcriptional regulator n=1 Tax=Micrococcus lylae TaxID=1273 RepID=UPI003EB99C19